MYGKIFEDIFCSTLMDCGGDTAYVFIAMIVLSDEHGVIKHTVDSLARVICKDTESVRKAIDELSKQDPKSNIKAHGGRRIIPLYEVNEDETRGWFVVNKEHYRDKKDPDEVRAQTRERVRKFRERNAPKRDVTLGNAEKRYTDTDTDTDTDKTPSVAATPLPDWLDRQTFTAWLKTRPSRARKPESVKAAVQKLAKFRGAGHDPNAIVAESLANGWQGLFEPKAAAGKPAAPAQSARPSIVCRSCGERVFTWTDGKCDPCWRGAKAA